MATDLSHLPLRSPVVEAYVLLALAVALGYALGNVMDKILFNDHLDSARTMQFLGGAVAPAVALPAGLFGEITLLPARTFVLVLLSGVAFFCGGYLQMKATQLGEVSNMTLLLKTIPLFALLLSAVFLGEFLTRSEYAGLALVLAGAVLVSIDVERGVPSLGFTLPNAITVAAAFVFAAVFVLTRHLLGSASVVNVFFWQNVGFAIGAPFMLHAESVRAEVRDVVDRPRRKGLPLFLFSAVVYAAANLINTFALAEAPAPLVAGLVAADSLFLLVVLYVLTRLGYDRFEEPLTRASLGLKAAAALLFVVGAALVG